jgi:NTP pyrophosphatase (non-canonical NTP hydrolase)
MMMKETQLSLMDVQFQIKEFNDERNWSNPSSMKDLLLNMSEEIGEMWSVIKWVDVPTQQKLIKENKAEVENFIGDMLYLVLKVSFLCEVDSQKSIADVMTEYEERFPLDKAKGTHGNVRAGGIDLKKK